MKKILVIADRLENFKTATDSTYFLFLSAYDLGFQISYCLPDKLFSLNNQAFAHVQDLEITHGVKEIHSRNDWYKVSGERNTINLGSFDAIFVRNDPPFNMEYYYITQILELAEQSGAKVVNHAQALRNFNEKLSILNFPEFITPTLVSKNKQTILDFMNQHGVCVAKPIDLMAGRGVFQISPNDPNRSAILESLTDYFTQTIMVQRFIPEVVKGDKRIFIVNGEVIKYCLYRIPQNGEIRGNLAAGGRGEVRDLPQEDYAMAEEVAKWLQHQKILFAGIDVIGKYLTEINITSPTGTQQIFQHSGINIMELVLKSLF